MVEKNEIYKCDVCGNVVEVLTVGGGQLVCCNKPMELMTEKSDDEGQEKHVPIVEKNEDKLIVKVGSVSHPMTEEHHIEWIEINMLDLGKIIKKYLKPGDKPEVPFCNHSKNVEVRAYCNLHGLWKSK
ncbi:desulfoferrodoxin [Candidatus Woesearchaeota archaeon]|jgi:superoxide reductase|nr:desulfoferrodoxin [Candidatus Woesearchaeota archaeon]